MKANVINVPAKQPLFYIESDIKLTISLLVSNRIDTIRKCLDSLQPILRSVPSELIIVDTVGEENSDGSLAVAKEYTDNIVHFEWCNDFAAARNTGLERAKGEWFMYIDDDEWFEDTSEIIEFFQSGECKSYGKAVYQVRNYIKSGDNPYSTTVAQRMARLTQKTKFVSKVHEYLVPMCEPEKVFSAYVHHYGYYYETEEAGWAHFERNVKLLQEELKKDPNNFHAVLQLAQEYEAVGKYDEMEKYCLRAVRENMPAREKNWFLMSTPRAMFLNQHISEAIEESQRIINEESPNQLTLLNIYITLSNAYVKKNSVEDALNYARLYFDLLCYLQENPDIVAKCRILGNADCMQDNICLSMIENICNYYQVLEQDEDLSNFLLQCPWEKEYLQQGNLISKALDTACKTERYSLITEIITRMLNPDGDLPDICRETLIRYTISENDKKEYFWKALANIPSEDTLIMFIRVMALRQDGGEELEEAIEKCKNHNMTCAVPYQELLVVCLENNYDPASFFSPLYADEWISCVESILQGKESEELTDLLIRATSFIKPVDGMKHLYLAMRIQGILVADKALFNEVLWEQLLKWAQATLDYSQNLYHPNLFDNLTALPRETRCALCLKRASKEKKAGNTAQYLAWLRKALVDYPPMKPYVEQLLKWVTEQLEEQDQAKNKEMEALSQKMKEQMRVMVWSGQTEQASPILSQLLTLLPNDPELLELQALCIE